MASKKPKVKVRALKGFCYEGQDYGPNKDGKKQFPGGDTLEVTVDFAAQGLQLGRLEVVKAKK